MHDLAGPSRCEADVPGRTLGGVSMRSQYAESLGRKVTSDVRAHQLRRHEGSAPLGWCGKARLSAATG